MALSWHTLMASLDHASITTGKTIFHNNARITISVYCKKCCHNAPIVLTLSTLALVLADVSTYGTLHCLARSCASSTLTYRLSSRSALFPTNRNGIVSSFFTRNICSLQWKILTLYTLLQMSLAVCEILIHIEDQLLKVNVNLWVLYIHTDHSHVYSSTVLVWECINDSWCFSENHWETPSGIVCILWIYYINGNQRSLKVLSVLQTNGDEEIRLGLSKSDHSLSIC